MSFRLSITQQQTTQLKTTTTKISKHILNLMKNGVTRFLCDDKMRNAFTPIKTDKVTIRL